MIAGTCVGRRRPVQRLPRADVQVHRSLEHRLDERSVTRRATRIGVVGLLARLVVFGLIGVFAIQAAIEYDPKEAIGLDGALQKLAHRAMGRAAARPDGRRPARVRGVLLRGRALPQDLIVAPRRRRLHRRRRDARRRDLRLAAARAVLRQLDGRLGERDRPDPRRTSRSATGSAASSQTVGPSARCSGASCSSPALAIAVIPFVARPFLDATVQRARHARRSARPSARSSRRSRCSRCR